MSAATASSLIFEDVSKRFIIKRRRNRSFQQVLVNALKRAQGDAEEYWALRNLTLDVPVGQTLGVIGENGSGKSTLLKLIARILEPTSGRMIVNGRVAALLEIGAGFHPDLTGRDNIFLYGSILGFSRDRMQARYNEIVEFSELGDFIDTPIKHYSSGMYMRLGFAVAINLDPDVLLLDEVLAVGDERFQHKCFAKMASLQDAGKTMILVSHDLDSVTRMCDRVLWLEDGRVKAVGPPHKVVPAYLRASDGAAEAPLAIQREAQSGATQASGEPVAGLETGEKATGAETGSSQPQAAYAKPARILDVKLYDADDAERAEFMAGERMTIRIFYRAFRPIPDPVFGLAIHTRSGIHVTGPNTGHYGYDIDLIEGDGVVDCVIDSLPLLPGDYEVSAAIHDRPNRHGYDWIGRGWSFSVVSRPDGDMPGLMQIPLRWEHRASDREVVRAH